MSAFLHWLFLLLCPHESDTPSADDPPDPQDDIADLLGEDAPPTPPTEPTLRELQESLRAANERTQRALQEIEDLRRSQSRPAITPHSSPAQDLDARLTEQEDQRLASADITPLERWQIESNRSIRRAAVDARQTREQVGMTVAQMRDAQDKTLYDTRAVNDKIYKKYAERVEQRLLEMRRNGGDAPRDAILKYLVGEDIMSGKMKRKNAPLAGAEEPSASSPAPSGRARSDVPRKPGATEHDKRRARLENVLI